MPTYFVVGNLLCHAVSDQADARLCDHAFFWFNDSLGIPWVAAFAIYLLLESFPYSILFTAVFRRSGGSLPIVILLHTSFNVSYCYLPGASLSQPLWLLLILVLTLWMWRSPKAFSVSQT
jgi:hypothetical protein